MVHNAIGGRARGGPANDSCSRGRGLEAEEYDQNLHGPLPTQQWPAVVEEPDEIEVKRSRIYDGENDSACGNRSRRPRRDVVMSPREEHGYGYSWDVLEPQFGPRGFMQPPGPQGFSLDSMLSETGAMVDSMMRGQCAQINQMHQQMQRQMDQVRSHMQQQEQQLFSRLHNGFGQGQGCTEHVSEHSRFVGDGAFERVRQCHSSSSGESVVIEQHIGCRAKITTRCRNPAGCGRIVENVTYQNVPSREEQLVFDRDWNSLCGGSNHIRCASNHDRRHGCSHGRTSFRRG